jgi:phage shock protein A
MAAVSLDQSAFGRFDRICDTVEQAEAEADALLELAGCTLFDDSNEEPNPAIEIELAELRKMYSAQSEN